MTRNTELPLPPPPTSSSLITVSTCTLNQWAMDFAGNVDRIEQSCKLAKEQNACYRLGPELEICGYGCEDHFYENDTFSHCWEALYELIHVRGCTDDGLLCDFGMPVLFGGVRYNCRVLCRDRRILFVRPKACLADNGNYREGRWFTAYTMDDDDNGSNNWRNQLLLPTEFHAFQKRVPFGNPRTGRLEFLDGTTVGVECCEELWTAHATHISLSLLGVDIIGNGSGSHHELRKLQQRLDLILNATKKCGGLYLYANQRGCDGGRCYYDGSALIACNGKVLALADQFGLDDVQVISATVDLNEVRSYRASSSSFGRQAQASMHGPHSPSIQVNDYICHRDVSDRNIMHTIERPLTIHVPEEECCLGPACWLWDFLRRSGASGFFLPLSGGADSSAVAAIVHTMTSMVFAKVRADPSCQTAKDLRRILNVADDDKTDYMPQSSQEIARNIFFTCYMGTSNSSINTESRSRRLAAAIGSYHLSIKIDIIVEALLKVFRLATGGKVPKYESQGGTRTQDLALQNIQARIRMVSAYLFAQLLPWIRGKSKGFLLVLGSANVDEALRGYFTKYDASSADLNPIGAINKGDLKRMLIFCSKKYDVPVLNEVANAEPTAELRPISSSSNDQGTADHSQTDEEDMGMSYKELTHYGRLRKLSRCGPVEMFKKLVHVWNDIAPDVVAAKIKLFFRYYAMNRHKMCTITPAYHAEGYSPDDNRFDLRQFLYNINWTWQFKRIDNLAKNLMQQRNKHNLENESHSKTE